MSTLFGKLFRTTPAGAEADGKPGFGTDEKIKLDTAEDMYAVRVLIHVIQDEPDKARALVRGMSPRDRALLSFVLGEVTRLVSEEDDFSRTADRRAARLSHEGTGRVSLDDIVEGHVRDI